MLLNADLIESIEELPDTTITLVDGKRIVVTESGEQIAASVRSFRAAVLAAAEEARSSPDVRVVSFPSHPGDLDESG